MQCVMQCMIMHEWNVRAFKLIIFFWICFIPFLSFLVLTNAKCKCHMQMPWLVLPMRYATIVPKYAIDRLVTTDLDVNFLMNASKMWCKSRFFISDANVPWWRCKCIFFSFMMQMSHAGMKMQSLFMMMLVHAFRLWCKCLLTEMEMRQSSNGYVMMQMSLCRNAMMQMF